ncbi:PREDICTED: defective chorion-1 protein, FC125 isoform isoform X3 [Drosophila arizonae]|uniref:Defective chorion-1 protein, FC125 isoform isoform X2 n=1 Tax=Drosophila arizonae TaxID=7263 RepID=A0ABM1PZ36_DROAR|nr:PREDICTED: defective chorion-1 protein, FC125 isoform isoform X2 [Drosophila arizonae]XP_017872473.1 PREDICTED: defective chorion-1 protein, FC125 isoform isoform X3 [Drosophila arizonae]
MRLLSLTLLLLGGALCSAQDAQPGATVVSGPEAAAAVDSLTQGDTKGDATNATTAPAKLQIPSQDQILAQMPPVTLPHSGIPTVDAFYFMFPALSSLLRWGSLFPAQTLLGAVPDNLQASPSKVVLVLADDANGHKSRVTRQDAAPAAPAPPAPAPPGALNGAAMLQQMQQMLGQMPPPNLAQMVPPNLAQMMPRPPAGWLPDGFSLGQMPPLPDNFNLGQMPPMPDAFNLGQMAPVMQSFGLPTLDGLLGQAPAATTTTPAPPAAKPADEPAAPAPAPAGPTLGQAPPPGFGSFFDGSNNLLGSALSGIPGAPTPDSFMAGLRQFLPGSSAQASDISEVRVKPEHHDSINYRAPQQTQAQLAQLKIKSALQMEQEKQQVPLLWFRMPSKQENEEEQGNGKTTDRAQIESKLEAFERQVIEELQQLQQIERLAREMRAHAQGESARNGASYKLRYPLSRTPVHKITRADIERALRDDYVRRLLSREMQRRTYTKRQIMTGQQPQTLSKEDIVKVMAYAYRMAAENAERKAKEQQQSQQMLQQMQQQNPMMMRQWAEGEAKAKEQQQSQQMLQQMQQQNPMMMRQWAEGEAKAKEQQQSQQMLQQMQQQNPMMMRQWAESEAKAKEQQRQWMQEQTMPQQENAQMMRQWSEEQAKAQQQQQMRQWSEDQAKAQQAKEQEAQQQMRQWVDEQAKAQNSQQQTPMVMQQPSAPMMRQFMVAQKAPEQFQMPMTMQPQGHMMMRQWTEAQTQEQQQRQWMEQQAKAQQDMQQRAWSEDQAKAQREQDSALQTPMMRQSTEDQAKAAQQQQQEQQRQWAEGQAKAQQDMQQRQWTEEQIKAQEKQTSEKSMNQAAERQWAAEKMLAMQQQQQQQQMDQQQMEQQQPQIDADGMLGEAKPQMPENAGQARHKVDILGLGGDHRKKSKSKSAPTIINYYHNTPSASYAPAYGPSYGHAHRPSYGTSYGGGGYGGGGYGGGGYGSNAYGGYRAAVGNDEIDSMLRQHNTMMAIKPNEQKERQDEQMITTITTTNSNSNSNNNNNYNHNHNNDTSSGTPPSLPNGDHRIQKSPSTASTSTSTSTSSSTSNVNETVGSTIGFKEGLLRPYMGLLPVAQPNDPWNQKPYDPHYPLYSGGGSYEAYLRPRRDTHIMARTQQLLTPGMLERLLRIKAEFQRRFPHLYQGMLNHHTNQTRVVVKPPLLVRLSSSRARGKDEPVYELGAAERGLFDETEEEEQESEDPELDNAMRTTTEKNKSNRRIAKKDDLDDEVDYFHFEDDDDDVANDNDNDNDNDDDNDTDIIDD